MGYPIAVPIVMPLKRRRPKQITVNKLKANIRRWIGKKLPKCTKKYEFRSMKANFAVEDIVIFLSQSMFYFKCRSSKYFLDR